MNERLKALADAGVSIWLDDLSRERLTSGSLKKLIADSSVTGVTTNPTIFAAALSHGESYADQITTAKGRGDEVEAAIRFITTDDVREACKLFRPVFESTHGYDGRVSIEVDPRLAKDPEQTASQARDLHKTVGEDNVLIKIPATQEGLAAITHTIAEGISVNVTLIFSTARYEAVMDAYMSGLEKAAAAGKELNRIHSVASFFVSRVDSEVDARLDKIGTPEAQALKGKAALANARIAFEAYQKAFRSERWQKLAAQGANVQRPLWASTGTKNKDYSDVLYVTELVTDGTVNTMPEKTMQAFADHGEVKGDTVIPEIAQAHRDFAALEAAGIDLDDVYRVLEDEGVEKFVVSWGELIDTVQQALNQA